MICKKQWVKDIYSLDGSRDEEKGIPSGGTTRKRGNESPVFGKTTLTRVESLYQVFLY